MRTRPQARGEERGTGVRGAPTACKRGARTTADRPAPKILVTIVRGLDDDVPAVTTLLIGRPEFARFMAIYNKTKLCEFHEDDAVYEEQTVHELVIHRSREDPKMFSFGAFPGFHYAPEAFEGIPSFGYAYNITGCELSDGAKDLYSTPMGETAHIVDHITITSTSCDSRGVFA